MIRSGQILIIGHYTNLLINNVLTLNFTAPIPSFIKLQPSLEH